MSEAAKLATGDAQVVALAKLISEAADKIVKEYNAAGHSVPSLDSTEVGPFDSPTKVSADLARELRIMEAACAQLSVMVNSPGHIITNKAYAYEEPACLQVVLNAKIADLLLEKPDGIHINDLAEKTKLDAGKLGRVLRMLATRHCFREVKPDIFANNRISMQLVSTNPVAGLIGHMTGEALQAGAYLADTLADPHSASSSSPDDTPFQKAHGVSLFGFYETPAGSKVADRFAQAMVGWGEVTGKSMLAQVFPWKSVPQDAVICDIGGGNGHVTLDLAKQFSNIRIIVQDLPPVIKQATQYWNEEYPAAVQAQRVDFIPLDFFTETPAPDCHFYYLRHVLHDWPNAECIKILSNIRKVAKPHSRLLIHEFVLQHAVREETTEKGISQAPEPLLANYGLGRIRLYQQDLNMMILLNSKERTLQEFISLGEQTGFKYEKLWDSGEAGVIEFSVV